MKRIGENIELFEKRVSQLVAAIDPSLSSLSAEAAATQLHLLLVETGRAETEREALEAQNAREEAVIANCSSKAQNRFTTSRAGEKWAYMAAVFEVKKEIPG